MMIGNNMNQQIIELKKKIRHLEIEIDYIENKEPENFVYLRKLNKELDELYSNLETLESENETN
jgi:dynactin complex subunit